AGITFDDVRIIVRNSYVLPVAKLEERLAYRDFRSYLTRLERTRAAKHPLFQSSDPRIVDISHHLAHAYSAFAVSPFESGAVMIVDGVGSYCRDVCEPMPAGSEASPLARESESYYSFDGTALQPLKKVWLEPAPGFLSDEFFMMQGLGALYSRVSSYIFKSWNKCGEVMGLSAYGRRGAISPLARVKDQNLGDQELKVPEWTAARNQPFLGGGDEAWEDSPNRPHWEDLSRQLQDDTEEVLLARARWLHDKTGAKNLCLAGGVALNCVANGRIVREGPFEHVWIQPAAGDDGIAIGCAYYGQLAVASEPRSFIMRHAYLGKRYGKSDEDDALHPPLVRAFTRHRQHTDIASATAEQLAAGKIVGWFQGASEFGPRALGNRSILADPSDPGMKDHLNARVKHRQDFRPFAPAILAERLADVFECNTPSPFMLLSANVKPEWRARLPAITHVDGSARIQTVDPETNPEFYALLKAFEARTGIPVLINTSFNIRGEPIVETPQHAVNCFIGTDIDTLVLGQTMVEKRWTYPLARPLLKFADRVRAHVP
ncbi:MAG: carbamoyltransferase C-terminal domain-containing protein, partial [Pseudomonadota bacterium]